MNGKASAAPPLTPTAAGNPKDKPLINQLQGAAVKPLTPTTADGP